MFISLLINLSLLFWKLHNVLLQSVMNFKIKTRLEVTYLNDLSRCLSFKPEFETTKAADQVADFFASSPCASVYFGALLGKSFVEQCNWLKRKIGTVSKL